MNSRTRTNSSQTLSCGAEKLRFSALQTGRGTIRLLGYLSAAQMRNLYAPKTGILLLAEFAGWLQY